MQAPSDTSAAWPIKVEQWGPIRVSRAFDVTSYCMWLRFDTLIRGALHTVSDAVPLPRRPIAVKAHVIVKHDRALAAFQKIEDAGVAV